MKIKVWWEVKQNFMHVKPFLDNNINKAMQVNDIFCKIFCLIFYIFDI